VLKYKKNRHHGNQGRSERRLNDSIKLTYPQESGTCPLNKPSYSQYGDQIASICCLVKAVLYMQITSDGVKLLRVIRNDIANCDALPKNSEKYGVLSSDIF